MTVTFTLAACVPLMAGLLPSKESPPETEISSDLVRARVLLPDAKTGFYRGTRFDWSGVIRDLVYEGHNFFPQWFQRMDPKVVDFVYEGNDIVAGPCTAITGPCEEFSTRGKGLGFDEAQPGGTFLKIGVGVLRKPDDRDYSMFRVYELVNGGTWVVEPARDAVSFRQQVSDESSGYGYDYRKRVALEKGKPRLILEHALRNTGKRSIQSSVYNHNFMFLDQQPPGPDFRLTLPFPLALAPKIDPTGAEIHGNTLSFPKPLAGEDRVYLEFRGFGNTAADHDIRIENRSRAAGVRITTDRPLTRLALWSIRAPLCIEPFIEFEIAPGAEFRWQTAYEFYKK